MNTMGDRRQQIRCRQWQVKTGHRRGEKLRKAKQRRADVIITSEKETVMGRRRLDCMHIDRARQSGQIRGSHVRKETAEGET